MHRGLSWSVLQNDDASDSDNLGIACTGGGPDIHGDVQHVREVIFDLSGGAGKMNMKQVSMLCLGCLLAMMRDASASELCGDAVCPAQVHEEPKDQHWLKLMLMVLLTCVMTGMVIGWRLRGWWSPPHVTKKARHAKTQSQTTYNGRFTVLHERDQGAWLDWYTDEAKEPMIPLERLRQGDRDL
jgi:hypothetical protein